jgi:hypothetical protein
MHQLTVANTGKPERCYTTLREPTYDDDFTMGADKGFLAGALLGLLGLF